MLLDDGIREDLRESFLAQRKKHNNGKFRRRRGAAHDTRVKNRLLEFCDFSEVEIAYLHRGNHHIKRLLTRRSHRQTHRLDFR
jgi:hypothetical protein